MKTLFRSSLKRAARRLIHDRQGLALVEFAYSLPVILLLGLTGLELANLAVTNMRLSQSAMHIADNASRIGHSDSLTAKRVYEGDINDLFIGVNLQAGSQIDLYEHGRVILSSLEQNDDGGQWIHWQRCMGKKNVQSAYGEEDTGEEGTDFPGMGASGKELQAESGQAVMYVEIDYTYQPIIGGSFSEIFAKPFELRTTAAFNVRGTRDLDRLYQRSEPSPVSTCNKYQSL